MAVDIDVFDSLPSVERASTAEQAANRLRDLILSGQLPPNTPLREVRLASALDISRNTVREALHLLASEGIVTHSRHRGVFVAVLDEDDIRDMCRARRLIETTAVDAAPNADPALLEAVGEALEGLASAIERNDWHDIPEADTLVHRAIVGLLQSRRLAGFYDQLRSEIRLAALISGRWDESEGQSVLDEHRQMYELLKAERYEECHELLAKHINDTEQRLLRSYVSSKADEPSVTAPTPEA